MDFKFKTSFSSLVKPLVSEEKDRYLALASLIDVGNFIPNIDSEKNVDLLPIAFNACVANRVNKNGDVIDAPTALDIYKNFVNKPINVEHNRQQVVGFILTAGFSEFGTDSPLSEDQVKVMKGPFNITLGGVVWKIVNSQLAAKIEESNDPTSEDFQTISASWELGFGDYHLIVIPEEGKNIEDGIEITNAVEIEKLASSLRSLGGSGKLEDGRGVYRKVVGQVVPLGIGLTTNPAADVKGIAVKIEEVKIEHVRVEDSNSSSSTETISHMKDINVNIVTFENKTMKITKIEDINEESVKQLSASVVADFIAEQIKQASENFSAEKLEKDGAIKAALEEQEKLKLELEKIQKSLSELEAAKAAAEAQELFNQRMTALEEEFQFDEELRAEIAKEIKDLNEESFSAYRGKMKKMAKGLTKKQEKLPDFIKDKIEKKEKEEDSKASTENFVEEILEKAEVKTEVVVATISAAEPSLYEKYKQAFSLEQFSINK